MALFFRITVPADTHESAREWAHAMWDALGFDYDPERSRGDTVLAWAIDISDEDLKDNLDAEDIEYETFEVKDEDIDAFFGLDKL